VERAAAGRRLREPHVSRIARELTIFERAHDSITIANLAARRRFRSAWRCEAAGACASVMCHSSIMHGEKPRIVQRLTLWERAISASVSFSALTLRRRRTRALDRFAPLVRSHQPINTAKESLDRVFLSPIARRALDLDAGLKQGF
jgi:hypothetical protein